jgi:hypothetical protein
MPFADQLISAVTAEGLARAIGSAAPEAPLLHLRRAPGQLDGLALRARADLLRDALLADIPGSYADLAHVVRTARDMAADFSGWMIWPVTTAVADPDENTTAVVRHGLRTLVKRGHPDALSLRGFPAAAASLDIDGPHLDRSVVAMGDAIEVHGTIRNIGGDAVRVAVDYVVHHYKANGTQAPKTFKLTTGTVRAGESIDVRRVHSFRPITTRRYYAGPHAISLQINGVETARVEFELVAEPTRP